MTCSCGSERIANFSGKTDDRSSFSYKEHDHDGYVPNGLGIGGGDYVQIKYCLDCGKIQSKDFPISDEKINEEFGVEVEDDY